MKAFFPQAIIFDMDGTLIETESIYQQAWKIAANDLGLHSLTDQTLLAMQGMHPDSCRIVLKDTVDCPKMIDRLLIHAHHHFEIQSQKAPARIKKGVKELLTYLEHLKIPCAVATNAPTDYAKEKLKSKGLLSYFKHIVGSTCVHHPKPAPDVYLRAAHLLDIHPESCWAVEDSRVGTAAAHAANMYVVLIPDIAGVPDNAKVQSNIILESCLDMLDDLKKLAHSAYSYN